MEEETIQPQFAYFPTIEAWRKKENKILEAFPDWSEKGTLFYCEHPEYVEGKGFEVPIMEFARELFIQQ